MEDVSARMQATATRAATALKVQDKVATKIRVEEEQEIKIADTTAVELKMKDNLFYQAFETRAAETTQEEKILALANALDPKQQTMEQLRENYRLFQEYYTFIQSEELDQVLANVSRLIAELQGRSKVEIAEILQSLRAMLDDVSVSRDLVEVMRRCRMDGTTVKELAEAYDRNEQIVAQLAKLEGAEHKNLADRLDAARNAVEIAEAEQKEKEGTFGHWAKGLVRKDTTYSDRVAAARGIADSLMTALVNTEDRIAQLKQQRKEEFEKEPLKILRSMDEADDNLSQRLVSAGQKGIKTIQGAQKSTLQLMQRAFFSESEVDKIARRVTEKRVTLSNLRSGLVIASKSTNEFKQDIEGKSQASEARLAAAKAPDIGDVDVLAAARLEDVSLRLKGQASDVIDYQGKLNDTINEITGTVAKNLEREQETDRNRAIVQGTKKSISMLGRDTLNTVAGNLEGVLHNLVADQTDEVQNTIIAFGQSAESMKDGMLQGQMGREREMHQKDMTLIDDSIRRLQSTTSLIAEALDKSVDEGLARAEKQRELEDAAKGLDVATTTFRTVVGNMSDSTVRGRSAGKA